MGRRDDIRSILNKKDAIKKHKRKCDNKNCRKEGLYKAPKDRDLGEYYHFCLNCVKEYNKKWNFFKDLSFEEIEDMQKEEIYGAKTKKFGVKNKDEFFNKSEDLLNLFTNFRRKGIAYTTKQLGIQKSAKEDRALKLFKLDFPFKEDDLKKSYKKLVKEHHPDKHKGSKEKEKDFKKLVEYKDVLNKLLKKIEKK